MNTIKFNGKEYKVENDKLYTLTKGTWNEVPKNSYFLSFQYFKVPLLFINGRLLLLNSGNLQEINMDCLVEESSVSYLVSPQYGKEEKERLVFRYDKKYEIVMLLGHSFEKIADELWKIDDLLYGINWLGKLKFFQSCENFELRGSLAGIWDGEAENSTYSIYEKESKGWKKLKNSYRFKNR